MVSVASQLIEEVTVHTQSDSLEDAREICAYGTYFPNNLHTSLGTFPSKSVQGIPVNNLSTSIFERTLQESM